MKRKKQYWDNFGFPFKSGTEAINRAVVLLGWKDFTESVLEYQREMIESDNPYNLVRIGK